MSLLGDLNKEPDVLTEDEYRDFRIKYMRDGQYYVDVFVDEDAVPKSLKRKRRAKETISEVDLCNILKNSNLFPGFTLHEEVGIAGYYCDMVYENGSQVFTIEAKKDLNYSVFAQACKWRSVSTVSYVAVPISAVKNWRHNPKKVILESLGLGLIVADNNGAVFGRGYSPFEQKDIEPGTNDGITLFPADMKFWKPCFERMGENLAPAGSKWGVRSTTFTRTLDALKLEAKKHPEYTLRQLLDVVPTHYSTVNSAASCLRQYAEYGVIRKFWKDEPQK